MEVETASWPLWMPHAREPTRKGVPMLAGTMDPEYGREIGLLTRNNGEVEDVCVLVCSSCYNKIPQTGWLINNKFISHRSGG